MKRRLDHGFVIPIVAFLVMGAFIALAIFTTTYNSNQPMELMISDIDS